MTRWSPDTCECVVEYDDDLQFVKTVRACRKHDSYSGSSAHLDEVSRHNRRKNEVVAELVDAGIDPDLVTVTYHPDAPADNDPVLVLTPTDALRGAVDVVLSKMQASPDRVSSIALLRKTDI